MSQLYIVGPSFALITACICSGTPGIVILEYAYAIREEKIHL